MKKFPITNFLTRPVQGTDPESYLRLLAGVAHNHYCEEHVRILKELKRTKTLKEMRSLIDKEIKNHVLTTYKSKTRV